MPIIVQPVAAPPSGGQPVLDTVVRAGIPEMDDCPILTRLDAFIVNQGVPPTLEHVFRDKNGNALDLSAYLSDLSVSNPSGSSLSSSGMPIGSAVLRIKDWLGVGVQPTENPIWEVPARAYDPQGGILRADLPASVVEHAGIYELSWGIKNATGTLVGTDSGIMSVERTLYPMFADTLARNLGPPTIQEIRMYLMDSSPNENLLLDDVQFNDEQIMLVMAEPVRLWNESPPPIQLYTTRNFPFRGAWINGTKAQLHLMAANHYRRNRLSHSAGGVTVDDLNKEREYMQEGQRLWQEYTAWLQTEKVKQNMKLFWGSSWSAYSSRAGW